MENHRFYCIMTNKTTTLYFVRHGQTKANADGVLQGQTDVPLDEVGVQQAKLLASRLKNVHFDKIYSSDLSRALVTAQAIADTREIIVTPQLREWNFGIWQGMKISVIKEKFAALHQIYSADDPAFTVDGGESTAEFQQRAADFMREIARKHPGETVLCVSHGGFISRALRVVLQQPVMPYRPRIFNTAISCFATEDGGENWHLVVWNDTAHLQYAALDDV